MLQLQIQNKVYLYIQHIQSLVIQKFETALISVAKNLTELKLIILHNLLILYLVLIEF